jgi:hypothetical protein
MSFSARSLPVAALLLAAGAAGSAAAETRSFVVNWFYDANYYDEASCPQGLNPSAAEFYRTALLRLGHPKDEVEALLKDFPGEGGLKQPWVPFVMTRGNGKDNVYANPLSSPDTMLKPIQGHKAYGFNLNGIVEKDGFTDPVTGEAGIDNQMYRAMGCIRSFRGVPDKRPSLPENHWDIVRDQIPAWVITLTTPDGGKDGAATVTIDRALDGITRDASGTNAQADMSFRIDPDPRWHNVVQGKVEKGVITTSPANVLLSVDSSISPEIDFTQARLRLEVKKDGSLYALIGGYRSWYPVYYALAANGHITEYAASVDAPGLWYALRKFADADPDPATGENRRISATFAIEAVPAFAIRPDGSKVADLPQGVATKTAAR